MNIKLGLPGCFYRFSKVVKELGATAFVSANALRRDGRFRNPKLDLFNGVPVALDSAGFVAHMRYGGFPWSVEEYVKLAASYPWEWWASMDLCCEPELARDTIEVRRRQDMTLKYLRECDVAAVGRGIPLPMPVIQGWYPEDYRRCIELLPRLPPLIGVGSACRRHLRGRDGLMHVLSEIDKALPSGVKLHLFGVKGKALPELVGNERIASVDSMAWEIACWKAVPVGRTVEVRSEFLRSWYKNQLSKIDGSTSGG